MIEIRKKEIIIYGEENEILKIFINSKLTLKERINAQKVKSVEQCENIILLELWQMKLDKFPLSIWEAIQPYMLNSKNFLIIHKKSDVAKVSASEIYLNKIK